MTSSLPELKFSNGICELTETFAASDEGTCWRALTAVSRRIAVWGVGGVGGVDGTLRGLRDVPVETVFGDVLLELWIGDNGLCGGLKGEPLGVDVLLGEATLPGL